VHLELTLAEGQEEHGARIAALGSATRVTDRHWVVLAERHAVRGVMDRVLGEIGIDRLDDFRLTTPSLEDVYLQLAGESLEDA
jgi:ABC-2 type transport system ATP-binding protein